MSKYSTLFNITPFGILLNHCAKLKLKHWNLLGFSWLTMAEVDTVVTEGPLTSLASFINSTEIMETTMKARSIKRGVWDSL